MRKYVIHKHISDTVYSIFLVGYMLSGLFSKFFEVVLGVSVFDELVSFVVLIYYIYIKIITRSRMSKLVRCFIIIYLTYLFYSLSLGVIHSKAILVSFLQQAKSFILLVCLIDLRPCFSKFQKIKFNRVTKVVGFIMPCIYLLTRRGDTGTWFFSHSAVYGCLMFLNSILFYYTSKRSRKDFYCFLLMLILGGLCTRSKYYGEALVVISFLTFVRKPIRINLKYTIGAVLLLCAVLFASWTKFNMYFVSGLNDETIARPVLYNTSIKLASDFFPLGSGFGSFADDASRIYYSPIYYDYGIAGVYGLSEADPMFITDTYFPTILGEFGVIGLVLFFLLLFKMYNMVRTRYSKRDPVNYNLGVSLLCFIFIENVANSMFSSFLIVPTCIAFFMIISDDLNSRYQVKRCPQIVRKELPK